MSLGYSIVAKLAMDYNQKNIEAIIKKGIEIGFVYHNDTISWELLPTAESLNLSQAVAMVLEGNEHNNLHSITIKINDTYASMLFANRSGNLSLMLTDFTNPWLKNFEKYGHDIDIVKYAKSMLNLIEDYKLIRMEIEKN